MLTLILIVLSQPVAPCGTSLKNPCYVKSGNDSFKVIDDGARLSIGPDSYINTPEPITGAIAISIPKDGKIQFGSGADATFIDRNMVRGYADMNAELSACRSAEHEHGVVGFIIGFFSTILFLIGAFQLLMRIDRIASAFRRSELKFPWEWIAALSAPFVGLTVSGLLVRLSEVFMREPATAHAYSFSGGLGVFGACAIVFWWRVFKNIRQ